MSRETRALPGDTTYEDVVFLLGEAARVSSHNTFVIAGSLCAFGAARRPPPSMARSNDIDMYPKFDPDRGFLEIAEQLGENSQFSKDHGFYADPITPAILLRPDDWESRMSKIVLPNKVVAYFMDVNDAAVGKLSRGAENDIRWISAGLKEGILNAETIAQRCRQTHALTTAERLECDVRLANISAALDEDGSDAASDSTPRPPR